jgi:putative FmdB family regulatory protein
MPTYEYKCDACGFEFEKFQSMSSAPIKKCPQCGKSKVRRLIGTGAGLIFKGSGFYITDYRDKSYAEKAKSESGASSNDSKPSETKSTDVKPAETKSPAEAKSAESKPAETKPAAAPKAEPKVASKSARKPSR